MKIGLITIHFQNNYGAVLQAYATQKYLSQFGEVEIIDYRYNSSVIVQNNWKYKFLQKIFKLRKLLHPFNFILTKQKVKKFSSFRKNFFNLSNNIYFGDNSIQDNSPQYDMYICGSDQIWNTSITNNASAYFLGFTNSSNKYSFASSLGHSSMTEEEKLLAKKYLPFFKKFSVREQETAIELNKLLNIPVQTVLDPVFLLTKEEWLSIARPINLPKGDFIVVYAMQDNTAIESAIEYAKTLKIPIVSIGCKLKKEDKTILTAGPQEFLYILSKAKCVITNSFHGFAFSLIFNKKIFVCEHTIRNLRLENLLALINMKDKQVLTQTKNIRECEIDGESAYKKLNIQDSKCYLNNIFRE